MNMRKISPIMCLMLVSMSLTLGCEQKENTRSDQTGGADAREMDSGHALPLESDQELQDIADMSTEGLDTSVMDAEYDESTEDENVMESGSEITFMSLSDAEDVVSYVEVDRYMGIWYEIATTPSIQQRSCYGTQADYVFNETAGWVDVTNRCYVGSLDGRPQQIQGRAELVDTETQAKLNVIFFNRASPYWVVALDGTEGSDPYRWSVVSGPNSQSIWILSRTPELDDTKRSEIDTYLTLRGFDVDRLIDTPQR